MGRGPTVTVYPEKDEAKVVETTTVPISTSVPTASKIVKEEPVTRYGMNEIIVQTEPVIYDTKTGKALTQMEVLITLLNDVKELKKTICGDK